MEKITLEKLDSHGDILWYDNAKGIFVKRAVWLHKQTEQFFVYFDNVPVHVELSQNTHFGTHYAFEIKEEKI